MEAETWKLKAENENWRGNRGARGVRGKEEKESEELKSVSKAEIAAKERRERKQSGGRKGWGVILSGVLTQWAAALLFVEGQSVKG